MNVAIDASLVVKLLYGEDHSDSVRALVAEAVELQWRISAPAIMRAGVTNVIRGRMRRRRLLLADGLRELRDMLQLPIEIVDNADLYPEALRLAQSFSLSTYDALYVALAHSLQCDLWTSDEKLLRATTNRLPLVRWIGDYATLR